MNSKWIAAVSLALIVAGGCRTVHQTPNDGNYQTTSGNGILRSTYGQSRPSQPHPHPVRQVGFQHATDASKELRTKMPYPTSNDGRRQASHSRDVPALAKAMGGNPVEMASMPTGFQDSAWNDGFFDSVFVQSPGDASLILESPGDTPLPPVVSAASHVNSRTTSLDQVEQMALATSPAVSELLAEIESLRGKLTQAGLPPNPTVGINGDDINEDGGSGRYGIYFGREIVRGNKLGLSRSVVCAEIAAAEQRLAVIQQRLLTDVRQAYYDLLVAQETVLMAEVLVRISQNAVDVSKRLLEAKEAARTSVLQSELELQNALVVNRQAENQRLAARRKLAGFLGESDLSLDTVDGNARDIRELQEFEESFENLVNTSPEIAALFAEVEQKRRQLARACVEAVPNVTWQTTLQYGTFTDDVIAGFQIGMPIPTLNRNQGAIHQARHEIVAAERRTEKKVLDLRQRLTLAYESYLDALYQVDAYESEIIPKAKETLDLVTQGYEQGEIDFLQLLTAQRTYSQINLTYLKQLQLVWRQNTLIRGMLLTGSLE